jgi:hypothetical protein
MLLFLTPSQLASATAMRNVRLAYISLAAVLILLIL